MISIMGFAFLLHYTAPQVAVLTNVSYIVYWGIKDYRHPDRIRRYYASTTLAYDWTTLSTPIPDHWYNRSVMNTTHYNRTHFWNDTWYFPTWYKYDCTSRGYHDVRFSCYYWGRLRDFCNGLQPPHTETKAGCELECDRCPKNPNNPCDGVQLLKLEPSKFDRYRKSGVYLSSGKLRWKQAYYCCQKNDLEMLGYIGPEYSRRLPRYFQGGYKNVSWIYLNDGDLENQWVWPTRQMISKYYFLNNQPDNAYGDQNCGSVLFWKKEFRLDDRQCNDKLRFFCVQKRISKTYYRRARDFAIGKAVAKKKVYIKNKKNKKNKKNNKKKNFTKIVIDTRYYKSHL